MTALSGRLFGPEAWNIPNAITISRFFLAIGLFVWLSLGEPGLGPAGLFLFSVITDVVDGYIARKYALITPLGRIIDPFVDKFLVLGTLFFLLEISERSGVTAWMVTVIVSREMLVTLLRSHLEEVGRDFSARSSGKLKMFLQSVALTVSLATCEPALGTSNMILIRDVLIWLMIGQTIYSGGEYFWVAGSPPERKSS